MLKLLQKSLVAGVVVMEVVAVMVVEALEVA